jgi:hypothetical protein
MNRYLVLFVLTALAIPNCYAWGERGHDLVTRIAVLKLEELSNAGTNFSEPFTQRDHMLSHLSNVPDFHWRADYMSETDRALNSPTHYIGIETVYGATNALQPLDADYASFALQAKSKGVLEPALVGTAPWRTIQLYRLMLNALKQAKNTDTEQAMIDATNQALLYAGLMSHFVGDLANPHHTTINHNGQLTGNTGLHAYFESDVIKQLPLSIAVKIERLAGAKLLKKTILREHPKALHEEILNSPHRLVSALVNNSFANVDTLTKLDDRFSILERSTNEKSPALRRMPERVAVKYQKFAVERLAIGASVLAQLWTLAWEQAGKPNLAAFHSYHYFIQPSFIPPNYLFEPHHSQ